MIAPPTRDGPRVNDMIDVPEVRLIDQDGENVGVCSYEKAIELAEEAGLDLVELSPSAKPPVCKILDFDRGDPMKNPKFSWGICLGIP